MAVSDRVRLGYGRSAVGLKYGRSDYTNIRRLMTGVGELRMRMRMVEMGRTDGEFTINRCS